MSERNRNLAGMEVLTHVHLRLGGLCFDPLPPEFARFSQNWQDGQITIGQFTWVLRQLGRYPAIVDSDHTGHSLDEYHPALYPARSIQEVRTMRSTLFAPTQLPGTIDTVSTRVNSRRIAVERFRKSVGIKIYTGVEADILDPCGALDINREALLRLQVGSASYHEDEFIDAYGRQATLSEIISAYIAIANNPGVDIINHPIRELSNGVFKALEQNPGHFGEVLRCLARENTALEINLRDLLDPKRKHQMELMLILATMAKDLGVKLSLGTDFHSLQSFMRPELPDGECQDSSEQINKLYEEFPAGKQTFFTDAGSMAEFEAKMPRVLAELFPSNTTTSDEGFRVPPNLFKIARPTYRAIRKLATVGIHQRDFINSSQESFEDWLCERIKVKKRGLISSLV